MIMELRLQRDRNTANASEHHSEGRKMGFTVAIDGPAASGKGTIAKAISGKFGFAYLDTGLLYRVVAKKLLDADKATSDKAAAVETARSIKIDHLSASGLRKPEVSREASKIAAVPEIRDALIGFQCRFAEREGGAVLDGRDIGTVVCPRAEVKLFVTANEGVRARRRHRELLEAGEEMTLSEVLEDLRKRDERDSSRSCAALCRADDAVLLDTSELTIDLAVTKAFTIIEKRIVAGQAN